MANLRANNLTGTGGRNALDGSVFFSNTNDRLSVPNSADVRLGSDDFTIEAWIRAENPGDWTTVIGMWDSSATRRTYALQRKKSDSKLYLYVSADGSNTISATATQYAYGGNVTLGDWHHVAGVRDGNTIRAYLNGVEVGNASFTASILNNTTDALFIGDTEVTAGGEAFNGYMSNVRLIKGTCLYPSGTTFTPPTEKLTEVDGTVLLCCQDSDDPTQEATGKTITGYGKLDRIGIGTAANASSSDWMQTGDQDMTITGRSYMTTGGANPSGVSKKAMLPLDTNHSYSWYVNVTTVSDNVGFRGFYGGTAQNLPSSPGYMESTGEYSGVVGAGATAVEFIVWQNDSAVLEGINIVKLDPGKAPKVIPPVGVDEGVTFDGDTKVNTQNYMYFPTGDTASRSKINNNFGARGVIGGGETVDHIMYNTIATTGNAIDFGNLVQNTDWAGAVGSRTRGVWGGGRDPANLNIIQYITIASAGNATDFGDMTVARREIAGVGDETRGCYAGGTGGSHNVIDYITIATTGNAADFGDLTLTLDGAAGFQSPTRGVFAGGEGASPYPALNIIQYITIQSTGNAQDFGDLTVSKWAVYGCSSPTRGLTGGNGNVISYTTISSTGNAIDFGDLTGGTGHSGASFSSHIRGVFAIGGATNAMDYVTIATTGNGTDFGDTTWNSYRATGLSNGHGGLF